MKTLILYCSEHGFTEKCAYILRDKIMNDPLLFNLKSFKGKIDEYDTIIIGGSIHAGKLQKNIKNFIVNNQEILLKKNIGLFLCCGDKDKAEEYFNTEIPKSIYEHSFVKVHLGHAFYFDKMNFIMRGFIKKIAKIDKNEEDIRYDNIDLLSREINMINKNR